MKRSMAAHIHPELRSAARLLPRRLSVGPRALPLVRALFALHGLRHTSSDVEVVTLACGPAVRLYRHAGSDRPAPALLWIHGGGYVMGSARQDDELCLRFARTLGIVVASVDYRLAPEHPYPAALDDCWSALTWLASLPGVDARRVAIGGASAGGGLAAALAVLARDRGTVDPVLQLLVYPMLDDRTRAGPNSDHAHHLGWNEASNRFGWESYLASTDPHVAVPARRASLDGLAPAWIGVGTLDLFHEEDLAYAQRLVAAGVACNVELVPGAFHGFDVAAPKAWVARKFFDNQCASLLTAFGATGQDERG